MTQTVQIHGTCVAIGETAVLLLGPPGSGKSDLALRLIDGGAALIADDRIDLRRRGAALVATAPAATAGLIEVRGIGIVRIEHAHEGVVAAAFEMTPPERVERLPEPACWESLGLTVPLFKLDPFAAAAAAKIRLAAEALGRDGLLEP